MSEHEPDDWSKLQRDFGLELGMGPLALELIAEWPRDGENRLAETLTVFIRNGTDPKELIRRARRLQEQESARHQAELNNPASQAGPALPRETS